MTRSVTYRLRHNSQPWFWGADEAPTPKPEESRLFTSWARAERYRDVRLNEAGVSRGSWVVERVPEPEAVS